MEEERETMWNSFDEGKRLGEQGSEDGIITRDEEHEYGSRITLERESQVAPFSITCGIYGLMVHTRFFSSEIEALREFEKMKASLDEILQLLALEGEADSAVEKRSLDEVLSNFIKQYP
jgi:hypothetical protein